MFSSLAFVSILYIVLCLLVILPPSELVAAGVTVEGILDTWLGSESLRFIQYHIRRTSANYFTYSLLVPGYIYVIVTWVPGIVTWVASLYPSLPLCIYTLSVLPPIMTIVSVAIWYRDEWELHPLSLALGRLAREGQSWRDVAADINTEFRRIDKFSSSTSSSYKVVATDSWLIQICRTRLHIIRHRDSVVSLTTAVDVQSPQSPTGAQVISLAVSTHRGNTKPFFIRINSLEYSEFERKLSYPIVNTSGLHIQATLADRFLPAFTQAISTNPTLSQFHQTGNLCIGCMEVEANIKLQRLCIEERRDEGRQNGGCTPCDCRPLWCLNCLARWFAARQDQNHPEQWLNSRAPCPTCRAPFCILDVCPTLPIHP